MEEENVRSGITNKLSENKVYKIIRKERKNGKPYYMTKVEQTNLVGEMAQLSIFVNFEGGGVEVQDGAKIKIKGGIENLLYNEYINKKGNKAHTITGIAWTVTEYEVVSGSVVNPEEAIEEYNQSQSNMDDFDLF